MKNILPSLQTSYDEEATYFEDSVRSAKRKQLEEKLLQLVQPACQLMLEHIRSGTLDNFKKALYDEVKGGQMFVVAALDCRVRFEKLFDKECEDAVINEARWDSAKIRDKFPDSGSASISSNDNRKVSREDIELVQNLIEHCLQLYMNRDEVVKTLLNRARIDPGFTTLVWQKLEEENAYFFRAYYIRLKLKKQIILFNHLLEHQYHLTKYPVHPKLPLAPIQNGIHPMPVNNLPMGYPVLPQPSMATPGQPHMNPMGSQRPAYPSSKPTKDWDKLEAQVKREEKDEKLDGHAALNKFFRDIYKDADDDTKRAMRKSFVSQLYFCTLYEHITYHWATPSLRRRSDHT